MKARWKNEGLPANNMSFENASIITSCSRWPLLIGLNYKVQAGLEDHKVIIYPQSILIKNTGWDSLLKIFMMVEQCYYRVFNKKFKPLWILYFREQLSKRLVAIHCNLVAKLLTMIQNSNYSSWLNWLILTLGHKSLLNVLLLTSLSHSQGCKSSY